MELGAAEVRETHAGVVFLVGDRAYTMKKPVNLGFLDFSTRQRRLDACRREVELNRRLAPDVYLGVADVTDERGEPCDHLVVMRRMPPQRRLLALIGAGVPLAGRILTLARLLAVFHAGAQRSDRIAEQGGRDALAARWGGQLRAGALLGSADGDRGHHAGVLVIEDVAVVDAAAGVPGERDPQPRPAPGRDQHHVLGGAGR